MRNNPDCLAIRIAGQAFQINREARGVQEQGKSVSLEPIPPEVCAGCGGSDPAFNEATIETKVASDGLLKVVVNTVSGSCPQATG